MKDHPTQEQWFGIFLASIGVGLYFLPISLPKTQIIGGLIGIAGVLSNAYSALLGRAINRQQTVSPLIVTFISMGVGSVLY